MKAERIVLSIIAILIGLFVAGIVFYFYQMANNKPEEKEHVISIIPSPSPETEQSFLFVTSPENESVSESKSVTLQGKAPSGSTIVVSTENGQYVVNAEQDESFSETITLDEGVNLINLTAIRPDGQEDSLIYTISYSTESY